MPISTISIIVAMTEDRVIGRDGELPWHLSADLRRFKQLTMTHTMIMGRKTYESIGRPLPGRTTIVVTRQRDIQIPGVKIVHRFRDAIQSVQEPSQTFIVGGESIYRAALPQTEQIYRTLVHANITGDTFFPEIDMAHWEIVQETCHSADERNQYGITFQRLIRQVSR